MEETTTVAPVADEGAQAQPNEQPQVAAVEPQEPTITPESTQTPEPSANDDNLEWLKSKGIDPNSTEAIAAIAEKWRTAEREMHKKTEQSSQLRKTIDAASQQQIATAEASGQVDTAQLALARVAALEMQSSVNSFFESNPSAKQHEAQMAELVTQRPQIGQMIRTGQLSIGDLHAMVIGSNPDAIKAEGGQQALQQLANKQMATAIPGVAVTTAPPKSKTRDDELKELWVS